MIIYATNQTESDIILTELNGYTLEPDTQVDLAQVFSGQLHRLGFSDILTSGIADGSILINNGVSDLGVTEALQYVVLQNIIAGPKGNNGRMIVQATAREYGHSICWTGEGDDASDHRNIWNGQDLEIIHNISDPTTQTIYVDFNTLLNPTSYHQGTLHWYGCQGDKFRFTSVARITATTPGTNTNFTHYSGIGDPIAESMILPAAGDGILELTADLTDPQAGLVEMLPDADGIITPGFWDADYNESTGLFENIAPNIYGTGRFNMFWTEVDFIEILRKIKFRGDGMKDLASTDTRSIGHGIRLKVTAYTNTSVADHDWSVHFWFGMNREMINEVAI
jgi:hypothetical protein